MDDLISRSEAIRVASGYCHPANIPAELAKLPSVNPKPCEDAISRQAAIDMIADIDITNGFEPMFSGRQIQALLSDLPSVTPAPKMGRWKIKKASIHPYGNDVACSECGHTMASSFGYKYCPMCGCRMMEGVEA